MVDRSLDSMASDSYLLKAAPASCPQYPPFQRHHAKARRSTSWRVVVALVLLLLAVAALAVLAYWQRMELLDVRASVAGISLNVTTLQRYEEIRQNSTFKIRQNCTCEIRQNSTFKTNSTADQSHKDSGDDDFKDEDESEAADLFYRDYEDTNVVEGKANDPEDGARAHVARLEPASGHQQPVDATTTTSTTTTTTSPPVYIDRRRRDVGRAGRPQPQLKLYHMLQTPGLSAAAPPPEQPWSQYGARHHQDRPDPHGRPQPMYAEHAPMAFVPPPPRHAPGYAATTAAPVASRRSRVMDGVGASPGPQQLQHRRRHQHRLQQQQQQRQREGGFQLQNLQDVTQEVPQGGAARGVEVGRPRWQQSQHQQQHWTSSTPRPPSWSSSERAGRWRDAWQERVRATRVTDTHQR